MNNDIEFRMNNADLTELMNHLEQCDSYFSPPLRSRVDICVYAEKIINYSMRFEAWHDQKLIGLVAAYCNDNEGRTAFVTSVSVLPQWQRRGVALNLLKRCIEYMRLQTFEVLELEVERNNQVAISLYRRLGFVQVFNKRWSLTIL